MAKYELLKSEKNKEVLKDNDGYLYWKKLVLMETRSQNALVEWLLLAITPRYVNFSMDLAEEEPKKIAQAGGGTRLAYHCADAPLNPMVETFMIRYRGKENHFDVVEIN
uniref:Uncharacterized protein n=1 Tax=Ditylenchus dipsaci TaxID=166011 RepID=A0A915ECN4_9BILA